MSEFAAMMRGQGVTPIRDVSPSPKPQFPIRSTTNMQRASAARDTLSSVNPADADAEAGSQSDPRWVVGADAKAALSFALAQGQDEARAYGHHCTFFALGRRSGRLDTFTLPRAAHDDADALLQWADRHQIEIIVVAGRRWKLIMHPKLGAATLAED